MPRKMVLAEPSPAPGVPLELAVGAACVLATIAFFVGKRSVAKMVAELADVSSSGLRVSVPESTAHGVYQWLSMTPTSDSACYKTLCRCFPGALPGSVYQRRSAAVLSSMGLTADNTLYGQSTCPDEINNEKGDLNTLMADYWGEVFPLGGIGGAPFVGKTGFGAFSHHVPDGGNVLVLYGPHIAISASGELGKYKRIGQKSESTSCGAILAAYSQCCAGLPVGADDDDMQQGWLRKKVYTECVTIKAAAEPLNALIHSSARFIKEQIDVVTNTNFGPGKLVLMGGIQINMPPPYEDHFEPLYFEVRQKGKAPIDLMHTLKY